MKSALRNGGYSHLNIYFQTNLRYVGPPFSVDLTPILAILFGKESWDERVMVRKEAMVEPREGREGREDLIMGVRCD